MDNSSDVIDTVSGNGGGDSRNDATASTSSDASSPIAISCGYRLFDRQDSLHQLMGGGKGFLLDFDPFFDCKISIGFS
ncbi:hypothetical protein NC652_041126 [Populus alba x Populus x berolinensis]|uniref:Uncharacterized protein n=1 Tax=Populus alba x Populus x berolinensis TaxID=444605 RepID=A0AAD6L8I0_9ROSI|nr:hypothetical protein NC652_041126 [Populus alba x Populus x berolinensis]KAJ6952113.1 hypothetical protein NC653_041313 [Populus alba x Populus x berolinensis]